MNTGANYYLIWELAGAVVERMHDNPFTLEFGFGYMTGGGWGYAGGWGGGYVPYQLISPFTS